MTEIERLAKRSAELENLPYRRGVGAVLFNRGGLVWVGKRIIKPDQKLEQYWQLPQGGIDDGEVPGEAVLRELREETGTDRAEIIAETPGWLTYDLPDHLLGVSWGGSYRGQKQKWFAMRFHGHDSDFDLCGHGEPEFDAWNWVEFESLPELIVPFKRDIYLDIVKTFAALPSEIRSQA